ncbi:hypothetical protein BCR33DRAFT_677771 [Rhizoclosmatium globosum]|uniref:Uncharacterized protein n=1 Tax=Rhizoclosmatium globosum TaxID=329046 RepID=A0A1Y2CN69_9FUNG|nr:hypothetical protein BCR33DRAFT_677771 [Rhizoclosmatium globosum]|eukprot:ORY48274.1 hypothetical protein BCR33DRAFT_677771 [Rhizoclosmatium globosum]
MMDQETLNQNAPALSPEDQADQEQEQDEVINWSDEEDEELNSAEAEPVTKVDSTPQTTLKSHISHL